MVPAKASTIITEIIAKSEALRAVIFVMLRIYMNALPSFRVALIGLSGRLPRVASRSLVHILRTEVDNCLVNNHHGKQNSCMPSSTHLPKRTLKIHRNI